MLVYFQIEKQGLHPEARPPPKRCTQGVCKVRGWVAARRCARSAQDLLLPGTPQGMHATRFAFLRSDCVCCGGSMERQPRMTDGATVGLLWGLEWDPRLRCADARLGAATGLPTPFTLTACPHVLLRSLLFYNGHRELSAQSCRTLHLGRCAAGLPAVAAQHILQLAAGRGAPGVLGCACCCTPAAGAPLPRFSCCSPSALRDSS